MTTRLSCLRSFFSTLKIDAFLVTNDVNIRYLTGFPAAEAWLLVTADQAFYITDFRYVLEAKGGLRGVDVVQYSDSLFETTAVLAGKSCIRVLGLDERHITAYFWKRLKAFTGKDIRLKAANSVVEALRSVKDAEELKLIRQAIKINLEGFRYIERFIEPGVSEHEILGALERFIRTQKVTFGFPPIIASGPNAAFPHARVSERKVRRGEPLLIDLGIRRNGYNSDLTRMFFLGTMARSLRKELSWIRGAQEEAFKVIRPGACARDVDGAARKYLEKHGVARYFGHSLGHGVGLDVHEDPRISQKSGVILQEGMVFTVEPGIYFPDRYGVRLEDMVLVTKTGCEVLSDHDQ